MRDQAEKLREKVLKVPQQVDTSINHQQKRTRVVVVTSGKGGVGKSTLALNIALSICSMGKKVVLMDADLGMANIDIMLGLVPEYNLYHLILDRKSLRDIIISGPDGLNIIPGGAGISELANLKEGQLRRILTELGKLDGEYDYMIIDTGAGVSDSVISFVLASNDVIVITTPEPTSLTDAYRIVKIASRNDFNGNLYLVVNKVASDTEGVLVGEKLRIVIKKFLNLEIKILGYIANEPLVDEGIRRQQAFIKIFPKSMAARDINRISGNLVRGFDQGEPDYVINTRPGGIKTFFKKFSAFNRNRH
ncbi:MAG: MinD/ParA family protein [Syntrophomonadaceae bacterium]|jgi:flagellar biosynthesis protein FlhG